MAQEIERKFLVRDETWRAQARGPRFMRQGYISLDGRAVVRVRRDEDRQGRARGFITIKGRVAGIARDEFEYEIPEAEAAALLALSQGTIIEKERFEVEAGNGLVWEVDVFHGANEGLVVAEIELPEEKADFNRPDWLGAEVSEEERYYNAALALKPYNDW